MTLRDIRRRVASREARRRPCVGWGGARFRSRTPEECRAVCDSEAPLSLGASRVGRRQHDNRRQAGLRRWKRTSNRTAFSSSEQPKRTLNNDETEAGAHPRGGPKHKRDNCAKASEFRCDAPLLHGPRPPMLQASLTDCDERRKVEGYQSASFRVAFESALAATSGPTACECPILLVISLCALTGKRESLR
jgi:hypothetical protein